jgi:hypothetical protein
LELLKFENLSHESASDFRWFDCLDPRAVGQMEVASNPVSRGAAAVMDAFGGMEAGSRDRLGDKAAISSATGVVGAAAPGSGGGARFQSLGRLEGLMSKATSLADPSSGGGLIARHGVACDAHVDVSFRDGLRANAALRFKTMAHELCGVPRGGEVFSCRSRPGGVVFELSVDS